MTALDLAKPIAICVLVEDMEEPPIDTANRPCQVCGREMWVASSLPDEIDGETVQCVCGRCASDLPVDWGEASPAPGALEEIQGAGIEITEEELDSIAGMLNRAFSLGYTGRQEPEDFLQSITPAQAYWVLSGKNPRLPNSRGNQQPQQGQPEP